MTTKGHVIEYSQYFEKNLDEEQIEIIQSKIKEESLPLLLFNINGPIEKISNDKLLLANAALCANIMHLLVAHGGSFVIKQPLKNLSELGFSIAMIGEMLVLQIVQFVNNNNEEEKP